MFQFRNYSEGYEPSLANLDIHFNQEGWGPVTGEKIPVFGNVPYSHFDKKDKIGRPADFIQQSFQTFNQKSHYGRRRGDDNLTSDFVHRHDVQEDSTFQLVDTSKTQSRNRHSTAKRTTGRMQQRNTQSRGGRGQGKTHQQAAENLSLAARNKMANLRAKLNSRNGMNKRQDRGKSDRLPSLAVGADWELIDEFDLSQLLKLAANPPQVEDLAWCGFVDQYDDAYDKLTTRLSKNIKRQENKIFYDVTTSDDPILEKFAVDELADIYATDSIIAQLMASPRSVYPWDIVVQKVNGMIFLDKRENSSFDYLTVSETALEPPSSGEDVEVYNYPDNLAIEATMINQNFTQQILVDNDETRKTFEPNPFFDDAQSGVEPASVVYRYRKFVLGSFKLIIRCELHAWTLKRNEQQYMTAFAFNEWDSKYSSGVNWRQKIDTQRGAVLATELKNNSAKVAKWTAQSILAGAEHMKLGYVSRAVTTNPDEHVILATQFAKPKDLAQQINLSVPNIWGIMKMICELLVSKEDGKYIIMRDPNKPIIRLYSVPLNTFEEDDAEVPATGDSGATGEDAETTTAPTE